MIKVGDKVTVTFEAEVIKIDTTGFDQIGYAIEIPKTEARLARVLWAEENEIKAVK